MFLKYFNDTKGLILVPYRPLHLQGNLHAFILSSTYCFSKLLSRMPSVSNSSDPDKPWARSGSKLFAKVTRRRYYMKKVKSSAEQCARGLLKCCRNELNHQSMICHAFYYTQPNCHPSNCFDQGHTGKCIRRFAGIYAYCRCFIDRKWRILVLILNRKNMPYA